MLHRIDSMHEWLKRFWNRKMKSDSPVLRQLSTTCFVLAGFSLTSLALFLTFYRWQLQEAGNKISVLLICATLLLVAGEFSREATRVCEYVLAELLYLGSIVGLLCVFLAFVTTLPGIHPLAIAVIASGIVLFFAKTLWDIWIFYKTNP
jgi:hypothetical protein